MPDIRLMMFDLRLAGSIEKGITKQDVVLPQVLAGIWHKKV